MSDETTKAIVINILQKWIETNEMKTYDFILDGIHINISKYEDKEIISPLYIKNDCISLYVRIIDLKFIIHSILKDNVKYYLIKLWNKIKYNTSISNTISVIFTAFKHQNIIYHFDQKIYKYRLVDKYVCDILKHIKPTNMIYDRITDGLLPSMDYCNHINIRNIDLDDVELKDICDNKKITFRINLYREYDKLPNLLNAINSSNHVEIYVNIYGHDTIYDASKLGKYSCVKVLVLEFYYNGQTIIKPIDLSKIQNKARLADLLMKPQYLPIRDHMTLADTRLFGFIANFLDKQELND